MSLTLLGWVGVLSFGCGESVRIPLAPCVSAWVRLASVSAAGVRSSFAADAGCGAAPAFVVGLVG